MSFVSCCTLSLCERPKPDLPRVANRVANEKVVLAAPAPFGPQQSRILEDREMSRKTLAGNVRLVPSNQPDMEFEKGLPVAFGKLPEQSAPRRARQRPEPSVQVH